MAQSVETGCIKPVASTDTFVVSTSEVEEWLQRQINAGAARANSKGEKVPQVNLTLFTLRASQKFHPFVAVLPEEALINKGGGNNDEELSIFNPDESQQIDKFLPHIWVVIKTYMYSIEDKKGIKGSEMRRTLGLTANCSNYISTVMSPRCDFKNGQKITMVLLDPLRIFFAMANQASGGNGNGHQIEILKTVLNQGTDYKYTFNRVPRDPKRKKGKDLKHDLERMMLNASRRGTK